MFIYKLCSSSLRRGASVAGAALPAESPSCGPLPCQQTAKFGELTANQKSVTWISVNTGHDGGVLWLVERLNVFLVIYLILPERLIRNTSCFSYPATSRAVARSKHHDERHRHTTCAPQSQPQRARRIVQKRPTAEKRIANKERGEQR
jgi:hypothetical protein